MTFWPHLYVQETNQHCFQCNQLELKKTKGQGGLIKDLKANEQKSKLQLAAFQHSKETIQKVKKEKKKVCHNRG